MARFCWSLSAVMVSGRSIFHWPPAVAEAPLPELLLPLPLLERPEEVLLRSLLVLLEPMPELLERSAVLLPAPEVLELLRLADELLPAEFSPDADVRSVLLLDELRERPLPELELASLRGEELLDPIPLLEPLPVLLPDASAPLAPLDDSRTSETVTSGAPWLAGKVTIATPYPFCTPLLDEPERPELDDEPERPLDDEPLRPDEVEELPLRPLPLVEELLRSVLEDGELPGALLVSPPLCEESLGLRPADDDDDVPALLVRSVDDDDEEPIPPLVDEEPERPLLEEPLASERRLLLPRLPPELLPLELPDELTGQLLSRAGFWTSPWTIWMSLIFSLSTV